MGFFSFGKKQSAQPQLQPPNTLNGGDNSSVHSTSTVSTTTTRSKQKQTYSKPFGSFNGHQPLPPSSPSSAPTFENRRKRSSIGDAFRSGFNASSPALHSPYSNGNGGIGSSPYLNRGYGDTSQQQLRSPHSPLSPSGPGRLRNTLFNKRSDKNLKAFVPKLEQQSNAHLEHTYTRPVRNGNKENEDDQDREQIRSPDSDYDDEDGGSEDYDPYPRPRPSDTSNNGYGPSLTQPLNGWVVPPLVYADPNPHYPPPHHHHQQQQQRRQQNSVYNRPSSPHHQSNPLFTRSSSSVFDRRTSTYSRPSLDGRSHSRYFDAEDGPISREEGRSASGHEEGDDDHDDLTDEVRGGDQRRSTSRTSFNPLMNSPVVAAAAATTTPSQPARSQSRMSFSNGQDPLPTRSKLWRPSGAQSTLALPLIQQFTTTGSVRADYERENDLKTDKGNGKSSWWKRKSNLSLLSYEEKEGKRSSGGSGGTPAGTISGRGGSEEQNDKSGFVVKSFRTVSRVHEDPISRGPYESLPQRNAPPRQLTDPSSRRPVLESERYSISPPLPPLPVIPLSTPLDMGSYGFDEDPTPISSQPTVSLRPALSILTVPPPPESEDAVETIVAQPPGAWHAAERARSSSPTISVEAFRLASARSKSSVSLASSAHSVENRAGMNPSGDSPTQNGNVKRFSSSSEQVERPKFEPLKSRRNSNLSMTSTSLVDSRTEEPLAPPKPQFAHSRSSSNSSSTPSSPSPAHLRTVSADSASSYRKMQDAELKKFSLSNSESAASMASYATAVEDRGPHLGDYHSSATHQGGMTPSKSSEDELNLIAMYGDKTPTMEKTEKAASITPSSFLPALSFDNLRPSFLNGLTSSSSATSTAVADTKEMKESKEEKQERLKASLAFEPPTEPGGRPQPRKLPFTTPVVNVQPATPENIDKTASSSSTSSSSVLPPAAVSPSAQRNQGNKGHVLKGSWVNEHSYDDKADDDDSSDEEVVATQKPIGKLVQVPTSAVSKASLGAEQVDDDSDEDEVPLARLSIIRSASSSNLSLPSSDAKIPNSPNRIAPSRNTSSTTMARRPSSEVEELIDESSRHKFVAVSPTVAKSASKIGHGIGRPSDRRSVSALSLSIKQYREGGPIGPSLSSSSSSSPSRSPSAISVISLPKFGSSVAPMEPFTSSPISLQPTTTFPASPIYNRRSSSAPLGTSTTPLTGSPASSSFKIGSSNSGSLPSSGLPMTNSVPEPIKAPVKKEPPLHHSTGSSSSGSGTGSGTGSGMSSTPRTPKDVSPAVSDLGLKTPSKASIVSSISTSNRSGVKFDAQSLVGHDAEERRARSRLSSLHPGRSGIVGGGKVIGPLTKGNGNGLSESGSAALGSGPKSEKAQPSSVLLPPTTIVSSGGRRESPSSPQKPDDVFARLKARHKAETQKALAIGRDLNGPGDIRDDDDDYNVSDEEEEGEDEPLSSLPVRQSPRGGSPSSYGGYSTPPPSAYYGHAPPPSAYGGYSHLANAPPGVDPYLYASLPPDQRMSLHQRAQQMMQMMQSAAVQAKAESVSGWDTSSMVSGMSGSNAVTIGGGTRARNSAGGHMKNSMSLGSIPNYPAMNPYGSMPPSPQQMYGGGGYPGYGGMSMGMGMGMGMGMPMDQSMQMQMPMGMGYGYQYSQAPSPTSTYGGTSQSGGGSRLPPFAPSFAVSQAAFNQYPGYLATTPGPQPRTYASSSVGFAPSTSSSKRGSNMRSASASAIGVGRR